MASFCFGHLSVLQVCAAVVLAQSLMAHPLPAFLVFYIPVLLLLSAVGALQL